MNLVTPAMNPSGNVTELPKAVKSVSDLIETSVAPANKNGSLVQVQSAVALKGYGVLAMSPNWSGIPLGGIGEGVPQCESLKPSPSSAQVSASMPAANMSFGSPGLWVGGVHVRSIETWVAIGLSKTTLVPAPSRCPGGVWLGKSSVTVPTNVPAPPLTLIGITPFPVVMSDPLLDEVSLKRSRQRRRLSRGEGGIPVCIGGGPSERIRAAPDGTAGRRANGDLRRIRTP